MLEGARKVLKRGDKHGCRTVGLMNAIYDKGYELRMKDLRKVGLDIRPKHAVVPKSKVEVPEVDLSDDEVDFKELYTETKRALD